MGRSKYRRWVGGSLALVMAALLGGVLTARPLSAHHIPAILVNSTSDGEDAVPGDRVCETATGNGVCTLRAAIQEGQVSSHPVSVPAGTYVLTLGDLDITSSVAIAGAGTGRTIIDGNGSDRVFEIGSSAFYVYIQDLTVQNGQAVPKAGFADYRAHGHGGAIHNHGINLQLVNVAVLKSTAAPGWNGGGINNAGGANALLNNITVSGNTTTQSGGGIENGGTMEWINATIANNVADSDYDGSGDGGGVVSFNTAKIANSIIAANFDAGTQAHDCAGTLTSQGYNLIDVTTGCTIGGDTTGNRLGVNPLLGSLNATHTIPLLPGSPAIDAGSPGTSGTSSCMRTDQRSIPRPQDGNGDFALRCDMGAYELMPTNLLKNGGFELDANRDTRPDSWSINSKFTRSSAILPVDGSFSGRFLATDNSSAATKQTVAVRAGRSYFIGCWANIPATSDALTLTTQVRWINSAGSIISTSTIKTLSDDTAGQWTRLAATKTAPTGAVKALFQITAGSLNGTVYVDHCEFR